MRVYEKRKAIDQTCQKIFRFSGVFAASLVFVILLFIIVKGVKVFLPGYSDSQNLLAFLTGFRWRSDQADYGVLFILINTLTSAMAAALIAFPLSVLSALTIVKLAGAKLSRLFTTVVELLAAVPSVVYGVFAAGKITAWVKRLADILDTNTFGGNSQLAVILLLAIMIYPTITSISIVAIRSVPDHIEQASLALSATKMQTYFKLTLRSARSGIFTGLILGLGRAFGEATAVSMVAGNASVGPSLNPFAITRTLTSTMLSGLHETTGVDYDIRFTVGMVLMLLILISNLLIHGLKKRIQNGA